MTLPLVEEAAALWRARALLRVMARREIAARHAGTALGIAWPYIQPLLTVAAANAIKKQPGRREYLRDMCACLVCRNLGRGQ